MSDAPETPSEPTEGPEVAALLATAVRLHALLDTDPLAALRGARALKAGASSSKTVAFAQAAVLIEAGRIVGASGVVGEGIAILRRMLNAEGTRFDVSYNLANGLTALADLDIGPRLKWLLTTRESRREARALYARTADDALPIRAEMASEALCNLGNALRKASRWSEAYDVFVRALYVHPKNGVAAGNAAELLRFMARHKVDDPALLLDMAKRYAGIAQRESETVIAFAGRAASERFAKLPASVKPLHVVPDALPEYEAWVAANRLALCPTIEGIDWSSRRWDSVHLRSISEPLDTPHGVPPVFAMFNTLKADFLMARDLAFDAHREDGSDTGLYMDTLDYAVYGRRAARATLAQRAAFDLLDRVGAFVNDYLKLGQDVRRVKFRSVWTDNPDSPRAWLPQIEDALTYDPYLVVNEGQSLLALAELAADIGERGYLKCHAETRNASTHRFTVLHDLGLHEPRPSPAVEHRELRAFLTETLAVLSTARSALLYLADFVNMREARHASLSGPFMPLHVPTHDYIRDTGDAWRPKGTDGKDADNVVDDSDDVAPRPGQP